MERLKKVLIFLPALFYLHSYAQKEFNIVPAPADISEETGKFVVNSKTFIAAYTPEEKKVAALFNSYLKQHGLKELVVKSHVQKTNNSIAFYIRKQSEKPESYTIRKDGLALFITGHDAAGLFYGLQTLLQLMPEEKNYPLSIQSLSINDYPRFQYRGMHFDVARHFSSVENVKKYIDYLAMYKFNTFHWHLTDDQGWRIEIKRYPLLTQIGSCREQTLMGPYGTNKYDGKKYCGYYTQEEIKEVVRYAAERYITVIPEIEMPGHALAALASYNYLGCTKGPYKAAETWGVFDDVFCAGNDSTFTFLQNVLDEVLQLFPSKMIHIGGDESPKTRWKTCPDCQRRIKNEKLKDEHELQSYFIQRIEKYVNSKGRTIIGWDEILEGGLAPNAAVMSWRGEDGGIAAARQHHNVVMTPGNYLYFDHSQSNNEDSITFGGYNSLEKVYSYEPVPAVLTSEESKYILGAQANLWTEYITNPKKVEYQLFPRIAALSEVLWSPKEKRNWENFEKKLPVILKRLDQQKINYSKAYYDLQTQVIALPGNKIGWEVKTKSKNDVIRYIPSLYSSQILTYTVPIEITDSVKMAVILKDENNQSLTNFIRQEFFINKASGKNINLTTNPSSSYKGSGAFTLIDGVHNNTGMSKSSQFLGFSGDDLEATIDLGENQSFHNITLRVFEQTASWIYRPQFVSFYTSDNGTDFHLYGNSINNNNERHLQYSFEKPVKARYIKVHAKNAGTIADGNPGAGNKAWLFVDEIEVN